MVARLTVDELAALPHRNVLSLVGPVAFDSQLPTGERIVLKRLPPTADAPAIVRAEANRFAGGHPNVYGVIALCDVPEAPAVAYALPAALPSAAALCARAPAEILAALLGAMRGLAHLHARGVAHGRFGIDFLVAERVSGAVLLFGAVGGATPDADVAAVGVTIVQLALRRALRDGEHAAHRAASPEFANSPLAAAAPGLSELVAEMLRRGAMTMSEAAARLGELGARKRHRELEQDNARLAASLEAAENRARASASFNAFAQAAPPAVQLWPEAAAAVGRLDWLSFELSDDDDDRRPLPRAHAVPHQQRHVFPVPRALPTALNCPKLSHLAIVRRLHPGATSINLSGNDLVTDETIRSVSEVCAGELRTLTLADCSNITDAEFPTLAACRHLLSLNIDFTSVTSASLAPVIAALNLEAFSANCCAGVNDLVPQALATSGCARTLRDLSLEKCPAISGAGFGWLSSCTQLRTLRLNGTNVTDAALVRVVTATTQLTVLALSECPDVGDATLRAIGAAPCARTLRELNCSLTTRVGDDGVAALAACKLLSVLCLDETGVSDSSLVHLLQQVQGIRILSLEQCRRVGNATLIVLVHRHHLTLQRLCVDDCPFITDDGVGSLHACRQLEFFSAVRCNISDVSMRRLVTRATMLNELHINECVRVTDSTIFALASSGNRVLFRFSHRGCFGISSLALNDLRRAIPSLRN